MVSAMRGALRVKAVRGRGPARSIADSGEVALAASANGGRVREATQAVRARSDYDRRRDFNFQLKEPLSLGRYDGLWRRWFRSAIPSVDPAGPSPDFPRVDTR